MSRAGVCVEGGLDSGAYKTPCVHEIEPFQAWYAKYGTLF